MDASNLVGDQTLIEAGIILRVGVVYQGQLYEHAKFYHSQAVAGLDLSKVGTALQRQVYESLRIAYADALQGIDPVGPIQEG